MSHKLTSVDSFDHFDDIGTYPASYLVTPSVRSKGFRRPVLLKVNRRLVSLFFSQSQ